MGIRFSILHMRTDKLLQFYHLDYIQITTLKEKLQHTQTHTQKIETSKLFRKQQNTNRNNF